MSRRNRWARRQVMASRVVSRYQQVVNAFTQGQARSILWGS
ncbi:hypothetical protein ACFV2H_49470 [Streptomyces sp. NPDC059629]